jgi:hypothetical protein
MDLLIHKASYSLLQSVNCCSANFQNQPISLARMLNLAAVSLDEYSTNLPSNDLIPIAVLPSEFFASKTVNKNVGREVIRKFSSLDENTTGSITTWISERFPSFDGSQLFDGFVVGAYFSYFLTHHDRGKPIKFNFQRWVKMMESIGIDSECDIDFDIILFGQSREIDSHELSDLIIPKEWERDFLAHAPVIPKHGKNWYKFRLNYQPKKGVSGTTVFSTYQQRIKEIEMDYDER